METKDLDEAISWELNGLSGTEHVHLLPEAEFGIPVSFLNYFERSKSKAALHEELLFKDAEEGDVMGSACSEKSWEMSDVTVDERESYEDVFKEHRERQRYREMEEQRRLREEEFQMELRSLIEHEKCQQTALELKEKMAQEKLEEEFVLQQELMSTFRKKVEEETQKVEEQQRRVLQERQRRKKKEEMESKKEDLRSQIQVEERQQPEEEKHFREKDEMINKGGMLKTVEGSEKKDGDKKRMSEEGKEKGEKEQTFQREHKEKKTNKEEQQVMNGEEDERRVVEDNKGETERKKAEETGRMKQEARKKMEQKRKKEKSRDLKNPKLEDESEIKDTKERTEEKEESQLKRRGEEDTKKEEEVEKRVFQEMQQGKEEEIKLRKEEESKKELENLKVEDEGRIKDITDNIEKEKKILEEEKKDRMSPFSKQVKEEAKAVRRDQKRVLRGEQKTEEEERKLSNEEEKRCLEEDEKNIKERDELNKKEVMLKKEKTRKDDQREMIEEKEDLRRLEDERIRQTERNEMKEEGERMEELEQKRKEGESKMLQNEKLEDDRIIWDINERIKEEKENVASEDVEQKEELEQMNVEEESKYMEEQQKQVLEEKLREKEEKKGRKENQNEEEEEKRQLTEGKNVERNNLKKKEEMMREGERTKKYADERRMMKDEQGKKTEGVAQEQIFKRKEMEGGNEKVKSKEKQITEEKEKRRTLESERISSEEGGRRTWKEELSERMEDLDEKSREAEREEKQRDGRELADEINKKEDKNKKRWEEMKDMMDNTVRKEGDEQKTPGRTKEIKEIDKTTCDSTTEVYKKGKSLEKEEEAKMEGERDQLKDEIVKSEEEERRKGGEVEPVQILEKKIPVRKERRVEESVSDEGMKMEVRKESDLEIMTETNVKSLESKEELRVSDEDQTLRQEKVLEGQVLDALSEHTAEKRLSWMKECISWSKLSVQNRRKQRCFAKKEHRRPLGVAKLPPLCADALLRSSGFKSLQEVTVLSLENLPALGSLLTLRQCPRLQSLTIRRCQLNSLEGLNELSELRVIDAQENHISYLDCSNMSGLKVLRLNHNKLTSIHGLSGAESLAVLELSYNSITRVAGLESTRKLQILTLDHNQLISTRGLRDVYTLQHLSCSHNHLDRVEGLENCALLNRLDLRANSLIQPPSLNNQVLLRELRLDDNSISSLQGLAFGWLPMLSVLTVAQNRITDVPSMSDFISLSHVDLRFNCLSEVSKVCGSLNGCQLLEDVYLEDNPLEQESCWRNTLKAAFSGSMATTKRKTDSSLSSASERRLCSASGSFLWFCQTLLRQTTDLQRRHSQELCDASPPQTVEICRHLTETQQLAEDQRFAHEYGDLTFTVKSKARRTSEQTSPDKDKAWTRRLTWESDLTRAASPEVQCNVPSHSSEDPSQEYDMVAQEYSSLSETLNDGLDLLSTKEGMTSTPPQTSQKNQDLKRSEAAVTSQQKCRKYIDDQCFESQNEGEKGNPDLIILERIQGHAAMAIQASWRGFSLRRRLASALAAVKDSGEDDTFEPVDVNQFVFDEATLDHDWTLTIPDEKYHLVSEPPQSPKLVPLIEGSQGVLPSPPGWRPKQAWENEEHAESAEQASAKSFNRGNRSRSPSSKSVLSGLSEASEKIVEEWGFTSSTTALLLLKRAQRMKNEKPKQGKDPGVHLGTFRNFAHQLDPIVARNMPMPHNRTCQRDWEAKFGVKQTEKETKQERALEWLQSQDNDHFLPELSLDILNGGPVQFMAEPGHTEQAHLNPRCKNTTTHRILKRSSFTHKISLNNQRKETPPPPRRVSSAPLKRESLSFRGNPAQMSAGWGSGKKTQRLHK